MKHFPFQSIYKPDFHVVEQVQNTVRRYPHTEQLPPLWDALKKDFRDGLSDRLAYLDHRGTGCNKIIRHMSALFFCNLVNSSRPDGIMLLPALNRDLVSQISVVQQVTESTLQGALHHFQFYAGDDFFTEIYLSGKRILFTDHALNRFYQRVPNNRGEEVSMFLVAFFISPTVVVPVNNGRGFALPYVDSVIALTFEETDSEFIITTCLTVDEINSFPLEQAPRFLHLRYGAEFSIPTYSNLDREEWLSQLHSAWKHRVKLPAPIHRPAKARNWREVAWHARDRAIAKGAQDGHSIEFQDGIYGPVAVAVKNPAP
jgi:hypothetical protein